MCYSEISSRKRRRQCQLVFTTQKSKGSTEPSPSINASNRQKEMRPRILLLLFLFVIKIGTAGALTHRAMTTTTLIGRKLFNEPCRVFVTRRPPTRLWVTNDPERIRKNASPKKKGLNQVAQDASKRLAALESRYDSNPHGSEKPVFIDYLKVIKAWAKSNAKDGAVRAATILERVEELHKKTGYTHIHPTPESYLIVIQAFGRLPSPSGCYSAEEWLFRLQRQWENRLEQNIIDDTLWDSKTLVKCYNICLDSWSKWSNPTKKGAGSAQRALVLLQKLKKHRDHSISPDNFSYIAVLKGLASTNRRDGALTAIDLIAEMETLYEENPLGKVQPNVVAYTSLINAIANSRGGKSAALDAEQVLEKMIDFDKSGINRSAKPNSYTYEGVMLAWAKSGTGINGAKRAEAILDHMTGLYKAGKFELKPLTICVNAVLEAWNLCNGGSDAAERAEDILRRMNPKRVDEGFIDVLPNIHSVNSAIAAWAYSDANHATERAEGLFAFLDEWNKEVPANEKIFPTVETYNSLITAHVKSKNIDAARKSEAFLYRLINVGEMEGGKLCLPNAKSFGLVINCWAKCELPNAAERAEQLLDVMEKLHSNGNMKVQPNAIVYTTVIDGWARSGCPEAASRAQRIFDRMTIFPTAAPRQVTPNTAAFNALLNAWAQSSKSEALNHCETLFRMMQKLEKDKFPNVKTNARSVGALMVATVNRAKDECSYATKAEEIFENMLDMFLDGNEDMMPDGFVFSTLINGWELSGLDEAPERIVRLLQSMEDMYFDRTITSRPAAICYNNAMRFFLSRGQPKLAEKLLERMETIFRRGISEIAPDMRAYAAVINNYAKSKTPDAFAHAYAIFQRMKAQAALGNVGAKPNTFVYNLLIATLVKSQEGNCVARAESLLTEMKELFASGDKDVRPDYITYSSIINVLAWSNEEQAATKALRLLSEMEMARRSGDQGAAPNLLTFNSVLNALSNARTQESAERAGELLSWMAELHKSNAAYHNVKPNLNSYTSVIGAWVAARVECSAIRAESILHQLEGLAEKGDTELLPNVVSYNKVLVAYANNMDLASAEKAEMLLSRMEEVSRSFNPGAKPDAFSYKTTLLAWSQVSLGAEKAQRLLDFMENEYLSGTDKLKPDLLCYKAVIAAWKREGRSEKWQELVQRLQKIYSKIKSPE